MTERSFIIKGDDGQEYGPVPLYELRLWVKENRAGLGTQVRLEGDDSRWQAWQEFPELVVLLAETRGSSLVPGRPELVLAPFVSRLAAMIMDFTFSVILWLPLGVIYYGCLSPLGQENINEYLANPPPFDFSDMGKEQADKSPPEFKDAAVLMLGVWMIYLSAFTFAHGRTPGKSLCGLQVVSDSGDAPSLLQATIRTSCFLFSISWFKAAVLLFLIPYFFGMKGRALHDLVAGTLVVKLVKSS